MRRGFVLSVLSTSSSLPATNATRLRKGAKATKQSSSPESKFWIASRNLSSGAHSRDPLARNDEPTHILPFPNFK
jgi:hypothetical protein